MGACMNLTDDYECICKEGYMGRNCSEPIGYCNHTLCVAGVCNSIPGGYMCVCPPAGRVNNSTCGCYAGLCQNDGVCSDEIGYAVCNCPSGYSGDICEIVLGPCEIHNPCCNFGTCQEVDGNTFCVCEPTHTGVNCSTLVDPCFDVTCSSRGTCIPQSDSYLCECVAGYSGIHCEVSDPCSTKPCVNNATCVNATNPDTGDNVSYTKLYLYPILTLII